MLVPTEIPEYTPVLAPMVATDVFTLDHVPPTVASVSVAEFPKQTFKEPAIAAGIGLTVTDWVTWHPVGNL